MRISDAWAAGLALGLGAVGCGPSFVGVGGGDAGGEAAGDVAELAPDGGDERSRPADAGEPLEADAEPSGAGEDGAPHSVVLCCAPLEGGAQPCAGNGFACGDAGASLENCAVGAGCSVGDACMFERSTGAPESFGTVAICK